MDVDIAEARRVLLVEDEALICLLIETMLEDAGYAADIASSIPEALDAIDRSPPDAAILDLNLRGTKVYPVAERLAAAGIPFVFATGGGQEIEGFPGRPQVAKPFQESQLLEMLRSLF
jgi:DNA-binding response OmpR family regulator